MTDPDWVAEATEPLTSSFYMLSGVGVMGMTVKTCRGEQRAKFKDWIIRIGKEIYVLSPDAYQALTAGERQK